MKSRKLFQSDDTNFKTRFTMLIIIVALLAFTSPAWTVEKLMIIGHKNPDTDAVVSSIAYANMKNLKGVKEAFPAVAGDLNNETKFVLDYFKVPYPEKIIDCQHQCPKVVIVDHNEMTQAVDNLNMENVVEVLDHHRIGGFTSSKTIFFLNEPLGATSTIIENLYEQNKVHISREMAGLMMSAILSDTVLFKSPTTSPRDVATVKKLSQIAGVDPMKFGMELLRIKSNISSKSALEILKGDFKKYNFSGIKAGVGQVEVVDMKDITSRRASILEEMNKMKDSEHLDMIIMMLTDVMKEASDLLFVGNETAVRGFEKAFGGKIVNNSIYREKFLSRKMQVIPALEKAFKRRR